MNKKTLIITKLCDVKVRFLCKHCGETRPFLLKDRLPSDLAINCLRCQQKIMGAFDAIKLLKGLSEGKDPEVYIETEFEYKRGHP